MIRKATFLPDLLITLPILFLLSLGILVIYSSDPQLAVQQTIFAIIGLAFYFFFSLIDFESFNFRSRYLYLLILFFLVLVFLWGMETRGSLRWIQIMGIQFQPSEFAKPVLILFLARFWSRNYPSWKNILKSFVLILPIVGLVFKQPDLGTALTLLSIWVIMLVGANVSFLKLVCMGIASSLMMPLVWLFLKDYQKARIFSFMSPDRDPLGIGYNVIQSTIAVGSGQLTGRGLGRGTQSRLQFLPEFRTDFMFASIAEEFGFIGSVMVLALYGALLGRSLRIISYVESRFSSLLVLGVVGMLFFQIIVNIGMNLGIIPVTGITLPLLSYGGSSLITTLISLGFIASVARFKTKRIN